MIILKKTIFASLAVFIVIALTVIGSGGRGSNKRDVDAVIESISFTSTSDITLSLSETVFGYIQVDHTGHDIPEGAVDLICEDESIVSFECDMSATRLIRYRITALKEGSTDIYAVTADGEIRTEAVQITVSASEESYAVTETTPNETFSASAVNPSEDYYVLNTSSKKIHLPGCSSVKQISEKNYAETDDLDRAIDSGYEWCKKCK